MTNIFITFCKELRSIFRDKKTIITLFIFPFFIPAIIFLYAEVYSMESEQNVYQIGIDYEANSIEIGILDEVNLRTFYYKNKKDMEVAYANGEILGYIDYDEDKNKYFVYVNEDSEDGMYVSSYIESYLTNYNRYLGDLKLIGEDIDVEEIYDNFSYEMIHLEGENFLLSLMFSLAFTYIVMAIVMATTNMATAASAVEKENGTLETILTFPIKTKELILGKYLATVFMGVLSSVLGLLLAVGSLWIATRSYDVFRKISFQVSLVSISLSILIVILASFFIAGLSIALTSNAHSYKEAQSVSSFLNMLTIIPMFISMFHVSISKLYYLIPIFNYTQVLMDIFSGTYDSMTIFIVLFSSFIYVVLVIFYIVKRYQTEKVLF